MRELRLLIEAGDAEGVRSALASEPSLANRPIRWVLNQENHSAPLHYVSDCVANGWLTVPGGRAAHGGGSTSHSGDSVTFASL
jgi:hypothetical protein